jgi:hypothetical protein
MVAAFGNLDSGQEIDQYQGQYFLSEYRPDSWGIKPALLLVRHSEHEND